MQVGGGQALAVPGRTGSQARGALSRTVADPGGWTAADEGPEADGVVGNGSAGVTAHRLSDLSASERRRAVARMMVEIVASWVLLIGVFYLAPVDASSGRGLAIRLVASVVILIAVLFWQWRRISTSELPELRAAVSVGFLIPLFFVLFATIYLSMSHATATTFTQSLDHTRALYFTVTVFSTVGFGDITPTTDLARAVVMVQMIMDLVVIGVALRVLLTAAQRRLSADGDADVG
jgi:voltage-gated potassium channel